MRQHNTLPTLHGLLEHILKSNRINRAQKRIFETLYRHMIERVLSGGDLSEALCYESDELKEIAGDERMSDARLNDYVLSLSALACDLDTLHFPSLLFSGVARPVSSMEIRDGQIRFISGDTFAEILSEVIHQDQGMGLDGMIA